MWYNKYKMKKYLKLGIVCGVAVFGIAAFITGITFGILHFNNSNGRGGFDSQVSNPIEEEIAADASIFNFSEENLSQDDSELSYISYRVKKGDMIGFIADEFGITQDTIISVNNIHSSRLIQIGQYLKIPSMPGILYTVRKDGETVATIAEKYKVEAEKCSSVNHIGLEEPLKAGKSLFVPYAELDWVTRQEINGDLFTRPIKSRYYFTSMFGWRKNPFDSSKRPLDKRMPLKFQSAPESLLSDFSIPYFFPKRKTGQCETARPMLSVFALFALFL